MEEFSSFRDIFLAAVHVTEGLSPCLADIEIIFRVRVILAKTSVYCSGACRVMTVDRLSDPVIRTCKVFVACFNSAASEAPMTCTFSA